MPLASTMTVLVERCNCNAKFGNCRQSYVVSVVYNASVLRQSDCECDKFDEKFDRDSVEQGGTQTRVRCRFGFGLRSVISRKKTTDRA